MYNDEKLIALLFPGQGSQADDMREVVERHRPELLKLALVEVGRDPFEALEAGTMYMQPAIYCASLAYWARAGSPRPSVIAGHSLGELAALVAGGVISGADGLRLAARRGRLMQEAADAAEPGGMIAMLGADAGARELADRHGLTVANDNAPGQLVLSGPDDGLSAAADEAGSAGLKARRLPVAGAFHSPAMEPAVAPFAEALEHVTFLPASAVVFSGVTARPFDDYRRRLAEGLTSPVLWRDTVVAMQSAGVKRFLETGPSKVLRGLVRRIAPECEASTLSELEVVSA